MIYADKARNWGLYADGKSLPETPDLKQLPARLASQNLKLGAPIFVRIFKREFEFEVWMKRADRFELFATYPVCMWSGGLGPKLKQGDKQAPEGFYTVDASALNPNSKYHRSFNLGFPNAFDRAHGRTGSLLMVHGDCRSVGCYAMTDPVIDEIWTLLTAALGAGQKRVQVQVFPFRMTETNMSRHAGDPDLAFWRQLQAGHDAFLRNRIPPLVSVCNGRYAIRPAAGDSDGSATIDVSCPAT
jgi:murein L,D-transpeptidase YafK